MPAQPLLWTARELDETGLYSLRARYYLPRIGRFLSEDPAGLAAGLNLYVFAHNSPVGARDPFGLDPSFPPPTHDPWGRPLPPGTTITWHPADQWHPDHYDVDIRIGGGTRNYRYDPITGKWDEKLGSIGRRQRRLLEQRPRAFRSAWDRNTGNVQQRWPVRPDYRDVVRQVGARPGVREVGRPWPRPGGSGGGAGGMATIGFGAGVLADGLRVIIPYRRRIEEYLDEDGNWEYWEGIDQGGSKTNLDAWY